MAFFPATLLICQLFKWTATTVVFLQLHFQNAIATGDRLNHAS